MIGDRLREERERLKMTQPVFAEAAGARKRTLIDWEKGASSPTAVQLSALSTIGVDVTYVVTGSRAVPESAGDGRAPSAHAVQEPQAPYAADPNVAEMDADIRTAIAMVADELRSQRKIVSGSQFVSLVERAQRYIRQGRELERRQEVKRETGRKTTRA